MQRFGWTRLACLFLVLTVLAALVRLGSGGAEARSLAARVPDGLVVASGGPEAPTVTRLTEDEFSALEDMRGEPRPSAGARLSTEPRVVAPPLPSEPVPAEAVRPAEGREILPREPPVFYRPAAPGAGAGSGPVCGDLRGAPAGGRIVFPLERRFFFSYEDTWGAPRTQGGHEGTDLMTPQGAPEYAITDGTVVPVAGSDADGWNSLGGHTVMVRADYSIGPVKAGDLFYYAHLKEESPLQIGDRVNAGQVVGYAGDTGQGPPGTSGLFPPHLHLGWYDGTGGRQEAVSGAMNPYPLLEWIKANGGAVSGGSDARFCEAPRHGPPVPSSGAGPWPAPPSPGLTPDLDTHSGEPNPLRATGGDRDDAAPIERPSRPVRPEKNPAKRPNADRPEVQGPGRPGGDAQGPTRPDGDDQNPPKPAPPGNGPSEPDPSPAPPPNPVNPPNDQYDPSDGGQGRPPKVLPPQNGRGTQATREPGPSTKTSDDEPSRKTVPSPTSVPGS